MPAYEYWCQACQHRFERLLPTPEGQMPCPRCGADARKAISAFAITGRADPGPMRSAWPHSWEATQGGNPKVLRYWRQRIEREMRLEEKYPELKPSIHEAPTEEGHHHHHHH